MRKLTVSTLVTLDGVLQDPGGFGEIEEGGWSGPYFDDEALRFSLDHLLAADVFLLGRETYELFKDYWSQAHPGAYTERMNSIPKLVASTTLDEPLEWNASLIKSDVAEAIAELKRQPGGDILMYGSAAGCTRWFSVAASGCSRRGSARRRCGSPRPRPSVPASLS